MKKLYPTFVCGILILGTAFASGADSTQAKLAIAPDGVIHVVNNSGSVTLHQGSQRQVIVNSTLHSGKVAVDATATSDGKRVEIHSRAVPNQKPGSDESKVDFVITVPSGVFVVVSTATAPINLDKVSGDISLSSETGGITVQNAGNSHIRIRAISAPVILSNITGHVEVTSTGGEVQLHGVSGPRVTVGTGSGNISYQGDFFGGGSYSLITHSGSIDVLLPETASVDLTARSVTGSVENDFPLEAKPAAASAQGRAFAGTSHSGSSSVELQSFSGKIRVKKQ